MSHISLRQAICEGFSNMSSVNEMYIEKSNTFVFTENDTSVEVNKIIDAKKFLALCKKDKYAVKRADTLINGGMIRTDNAGISCYAALLYLTEASKSTDFYVFFYIVNKYTVKWAICDSSKKLSSSKSIFELERNAKILMYEDSRNDAVIKFNGAFSGLYIGTEFSTYEDIRPGLLYGIDLNRPKATKAFLDKVFGAYNKEYKVGYASKTLDKFSEELEKMNAAAKIVIRQANEILSKTYDIRRKLGILAKDATINGKTIEWIVDMPRRFRHQDEYTLSDDEQALYHEWSKQEHEIYMLLQNLANEYDIEFSMHS